MAFVRPAHHRQPAASAALTISNGASVNAAQGQQRCWPTMLGEAAGGSGGLTVTGAGSLATLVGQVDVGQAGSGSLTIANAGAVFSGSSAKAPTQGIDTGQYAGGTGGITVSGTGSRLGNTGQFVVGDAGVGSLTVAAGGDVDTTPGSVAGLAGLSIANTVGASGSSVNVSGSADAVGRGRRKPGRWFRRVRGIADQRRSDRHCRRTGCRYSRRFAWANCAVRPCDLVTGAVPPADAGTAAPSSVERCHARRPPARPSALRAPVPAR